MGVDNNIKAHKQIMDVSDKFFDKHGYEGDIVFINKPLYLQILREKEGLRQLMGEIKRKLENRIILGMEVRLHRSKKIKIKMKKK